MKNKNLKINIVGILAVLLFTALDQITKYFAAMNLKEGPFVLWDGVFELHYLENRGAAFGILQGQKWLIVVMGIIILAVICYFYLKMPYEKRYLPLRIISVFIIAGAFGNMIDRILYNYVIDFFYFKLINFPVFNVADIYVTLSAVFLFILFLFYYKEDELSFLTFKKHNKGEDENHAAK